MGAPDRGGVRLAELVAALSLGIDLGFDQPMEHVLRQCLIALRLAERAGVDEQTRVSVYYTALLVDAGALGQPQRDQALAKDVLHRLVEPEVDAE